MKSDPWADRIAGGMAGDIMGNRNIMPSKPKPEQVAQDFTISQISSNACELSIRCLSFTIHCDDDLTNGDLQLFSKIEKLLNTHSAELLAD